MQASQRVFTKGKKTSSCRRMYPVSHFFQEDLNVRYKIQQFTLVCTKVRLLQTIWSNIYTGRIFASYYVVHAGKVRRLERENFCLGQIPKRKRRRRRRRQMELWAEREREREDKGKRKGVTCDSQSSGPSSQ